MSKILWVARARAHSSGKRRSNRVSNSPATFFTAATRPAETLGELGFNVAFLSSKTYVKRKLRSLKCQDLKKIRQAFKDNKHPRLMKQFFYHQPYGRGNLFNELINRAGPEKLARLIRIVGLLSQTKAYLSWKQTDSFCSNASIKA